MSLRRPPAVSLRNSALLVTAIQCELLLWRVKADEPARGREWFRNGTLYRRRFRAYAARWKKIRAPRQDPDRWGLASFVLTVLKHEAIVLPPLCSFARTLAAHRHLVANNRVTTLIWWC